MSMKNEARSPDTPLVYICPYRGKDKFKVGCTTIRDLSRHCCRANNRSVGDEVCLGVQYCKSESHARNLKSKVKTYVMSHIGRKSESDIIFCGNPILKKAVDKAIREYFTDVNTPSGISRILSRSRRLRRRFDRRRR